MRRRLVEDEGGADRVDDGEEGRKGQEEGGENRARPGAGVHAAGSGPGARPKKASTSVATAAVPAPGRPERGAERQDLVVEVVARVVHRRAADAPPSAWPMRTKQPGTAAPCRRNPRRPCRAALADDVCLAEQLGRRPAPRVRSPPRAFTTAGSRARSRPPRSRRAPRRCSRPISAHQRLDLVLHLGRSVRTVPFSIRLLGDDVAGAAARGTGVIESTALSSGSVRRATRLCSASTMWRRSPPGRSCDAAGRRGRRGRRCGCVKSVGRGATRRRPPRSWCRPAGWSRCARRTPCRRGSGRTAPPRP